MLARCVARSYGLRWQVALAGNKPYKGKMIVILAGYENKIDSFLLTNQVKEACCFYRRLRMLPLTLPCNLFPQGLSSRFRRKLRFTKWSAADARGYIESLILAGTLSFSFSHTLSLSPAYSLLYLFSPSSVSLLSSALPSLSVWCDSALFVLSAVSLLFIFSVCCISAPLFDVSVYVYLASSLLVESHPPSRARSVSRWQLIIWFLTGCFVTGHRTFTPAFSAALLTKLESLAAAEGWGSGRDAGNYWRYLSENWSKRFVSSFNSNFLTSCRF